MKMEIHRAPKPLKVLVALRRYPPVSFGGGESMTT